MESVGVRSKNQAHLSLLDIPRVARPPSDEVGLPRNFLKGEILESERAVSKVVSYTELAALVTQSRRKSNCFRVKI